MTKRGSHVSQTYPPRGHHAAGPAEYVAVIRKRVEYASVLATSLKPRVPAICVGAAELSGNPGSKAEPERVPHLLRIYAKASLDALAERIYARRAAGVGRTQKRTARPAGKSNRHPEPAPRFGCVNWFWNRNDGKRKTLALGSIQA